MKLSDVMRIVIVVLVACGLIVSNVSCMSCISLVKKLKSGSTTSGQVEVSVNSNNASNIGSLEFELVYDPAVLQAQEVKKGALADNAMIDFSISQPGRVWVAMVDSNGISGNGSLVVISFSNTGQKQTSTSLTLENVQAYDATTLIDMVTNTVPGNLTAPPAINFTR
ncbi:MAG: hypothetical protein JXA01_06935 [Dehalococcoidia bacterium]|nr:hypothetical protein [Dehalococcoidia bacterium]